MSKIMETEKKYNNHFIKCFRKAQTNILTSYSEIYTGFSPFSSTDT